MISNYLNLLRFTQIESLQEIHLDLISEVIQFLLGLNTFCHNRGSLPVEMLYQSGNIFLLFRRTVNIGDKGPIELNKVRGEYGDSRHIVVAGRVVIQSDSETVRLNVTSFD